MQRYSTGTRWASTSMIGRSRIHHWSIGRRCSQSASSSARRSDRIRTVPSCSPMTALPVFLVSIWLLSQSMECAASRVPRMRSNGARRAALLGLAEHDLAGVEQALALLLEQPAQEVGGVHRAGLLVRHRQEQPLADPEAVDHPLDVVRRGP